MRGGPLFHTLKVSADGPLGHLAYRADVAGLSSGTPFRLAGTGVYSQAATAGADNGLSFDGAGRVRGVDVRTTGPARLTFAGDRYGAALALGVGGGRIVAQVNGVGPKIAGRASLSGLALTAFDPDYTGVISGDLTVQGSGPTLGGTLDARVGRCRPQGAEGRLRPGRPGRGDARRVQPARLDRPDLRQGIERADQRVAAGGGVVVAVPHRRRAAAADDGRLRHRRRARAAVGPHHGRRPDAVGPSGRQRRAGRHAGRSAPGRDRDPRPGTVRRHLHRAQAAERQRGRRPARQRHRRLHLRRQGRRARLGLRLRPHRPRTGRRLRPPARAQGLPPDRQRHRPGHGLGQDRRRPGGQRQGQALRRPDHRPRPDRAQRPDPDRRRAHGRRRDPP